MEYEALLGRRLKDSRVMRPDELNILNFDLGHVFGTYAKQFLGGRPVDLVASHGHTIFHAPHLGMTLQIGHPAGIAAVMNCPVVADFRSVDVVLGGQGAPLVPVGDHLLFPAYDACLNLGGIANVSLEQASIAFDICPVNTILNYLSQQLGLDYDPEGENAARGVLDKQVLRSMNGLDYYKKSPPKSLGMEWVEKEIFPLLIDLSVADALRTSVEHLAYQIGKNLPAGQRILVTGGGAHNVFLMDRIRALSESKIIVPTKEIVDFKEALIFAFLGVLRWRKEVNTRCLVTGATRDSIGGCVYLPVPSAS